MMVFFCWQLATHIQINECNNIVSNIFITEIYHKYTYLHEASALINVNERLIIMEFYKN